METPKQSSKHRHSVPKQHHSISDLHDMPENELQKIRDKASVIHSKMITDLGLVMNRVRKSTVTMTDVKRKEELTKKMISLKLFMAENHKEQAKRRWTREADWVSEDGKNEWSLDYSHDENAWTATNPNYKPPVESSPVVDEIHNDEEALKAKEALKYLRPPPNYGASKTSKKPAPKKVVQIEPSHNHHQMPVVYKNGPPSPRSGKAKPVTAPKQVLSNNIQHSDDGASDDGVDDGQVIMIVGGVALLLALVFMIYTTVQ